VEEVVITSSDLVEHATLLRKRVETNFRKDFLLRKGAKEEDAHVVALTKQVAQIDERLAPLDEKVRSADLVTIVPHRAEIIALTSEIEQHPKEKLDEAMKLRSGEVFELMKKRSEYTKANYDNRDQIARAIILINCLPRKEAEKLKTVVESHTNEEIDVGALDEQRQKNLVSTMGRLGVFAYISNSKLTLDKKKFEGERPLVWEREVKKTPPEKGRGNEFWVSGENEQKWDENERKFAAVSKRMLVLTTKGHAEPMSEAEKIELEKLQKEYILLREERERLANTDEDISISMSQVPPKEEEKVPKQEEREISRSDIAEEGQTREDEILADKPVAEEAQEEKDKPEAVSQDFSKDEDVQKIQDVQKAGEE